MFFLYFREDLRIEATHFLENAFLLIVKMLEMEVEIEEDTSELVDELLHSIFFLGRLTYQFFLPERIFEGSDLLDDLMSNYPNAFELYMSHVPRRSPFSCVLDMIVHLIGQENVELIKEELGQLSSTLVQNDNSKILNSTMVCISWAESVRYYGVSMSTHHKPGRQIVIAASCLNFWDDCVADAVMTYCPQKKKKKYFDGTIRLPAEVRCEAFNIRERRSMPPCVSCSDLFGLQTTETENKSPYGNCAEAESLSKLFKNENVKERVQRSDNWNKQDRTRAEQDVLRHLKQVLKNNQHFEWNNKEINFYIPHARLDSEEDEDFNM
ncbi:uncharacterized protein LOC106524771 [Austrofundulus limnaeus]|uniref:Uncharacterized protein LOC106524771 n=1 Tax=Austrofundulus limnaeus TaxID=52670 RepID=A0A2I4C2J4_AUSLI|nr:PREDICTED: uncharacterized protein LOC106524771 [Austrofundulus limnaeus]